jgi:phosphoribosylanthranilate isomerase
MKIKICGLFRSVDVSYVNDAHPDYAGFVFAESRRKISHSFAAELRSSLDRTITSVGVFVNAPIEEIKDIYDEGTIEIAQLHGDEDRAYIRDLKDHCGITVVKAVRLMSEKDVLSAEKSGADYLLFDNGTGGTGSRFDWSLVRNATVPFFLAGGINLSNIGDALNLVPHPYALDISSGAEVDGFKDRDTIIKLVESVRNEDREEGIWERKHNDR